MNFWTINFITTHIGPALLVSIAVSLGSIANSLSGKLSRQRFLFFLGLWGGIFLIFCLSSSSFQDYILSPSKLEQTYVKTVCAYIYCSTIYIFSAYLLGAIPFGLLLSRFNNLPDPRTFGSKNIGATNVLRTGNKFTALTTLFADGVKGSIAVKIFYNAAPYPLCSKGAVFSPEIFQWILGLSAILGHIFPLWLKFKGGKGVATVLGVYAVLFTPVEFLILLAVWVLTAFCFQYSSLASLGMVWSTLPLSYYWEKNNFVIFLIALLITFRHKDNLLRLYHQTENKISFLRKKL